MEVAYPKLQLNQATLFMVLVMVYKSSILTKCSDTSVVNVKIIIPSVQTFIEERISSLILRHQISSINVPEVDSQPRDG